MEEHGQREEVRVPTAVRVEVPPESVADPLRVVVQHRRRPGRLVRRLCGPRAHATEVYQEHLEHGRLQQAVVAGGLVERSLDLPLQHLPIVAPGPRQHRALLPCDLLGLEPEALDHRPLPLSAVERVAVEQLRGRYLPHGVRAAVHQRELQQLVLRRCGGGRRGRGRVVGRALGADGVPVGVEDGELHEPQRVLLQVGPRARFVVDGGGPIAALQHGPPAEKRTAERLLDVLEEAVAAHEAWHGHERRGALQPADAVRLRRALEDEAA
mmetsp:Transcript_93329/g.269551  ORF Transcript_93329/g.269551 Transcript_93329/m.269551 type:complete len:268 (-) Transcript_93329:292-1095(-)